MLKKLSFFVLFKYINFAVKGVKGLLIAKILGPYAFGIWAFILMIEQYISYKNLGIPFTLNIELSNNFDNKKFIDDYVTKCFNLYSLIAISFLFIAFLYRILDVQLFSEFKLNDFIVIIVLHATLKNYQSIFANIYRVFNKFKLIIISEFLFHALPLVTVFFYEGTDLIYALLIAAIISLLVSLGFYAYNSPVHISYFKFTKNNVLTSVIIKDGLLLLMINVSVYLFNLASKSYVSVYYTIEELGQFSFAISITMASLLGIKAALWAVYPNIIRKISSIKDDIELSSFINKIERMNSFLFINLIHIVILVTPILYIGFPEYKPSSDVLIILLVAQGIVSMGIGYNTFIMNRKKFTALVKINLIALIFSLVSNFVIASNGMKLVFIAHIILISYLLVLLGMNSIYRKSLFNETFFGSFKGMELRKLLHMLFLAILITAFGVNTIYIAMTSIVIFNIVNYSDLKLIKGFVKVGAA